MNTESRREAFWYLEHLRNGSRSNDAPCITDGDFDPEHLLEQALSYVLTVSDLHRSSMMISKLKQKAEQKIASVKSESNRYQHADLIQQVEVQIEFEALEMQVRSLQMILDKNQNVLRTYDYGGGSHGSYPDPVPVPVGLRPASLGSRLSDFNRPR